MIEQEHPPKFSTGLAYLMATGTVLAWSIGIVIGRGIFELTPPVGLSFWRWFIPTLCLAPWVIPRIREEGITLIKTWKPLCAMGNIHGRIQCAFYAFHQLYNSH